MCGSAWREAMNLHAFLLVDVGNTRVKWTVAPMPGYDRVDFPVDLPAGTGEMPTAEATPSRVGTLAKQFRRHYLVLSSVVPALTPLFSRVFNRRFHLVNSDSPTLGLDFDYPNPAEIGSDRLAAAVAAQEAGKWPVIVVSCGTATTFTVLDAKGRFCGGAIAPGLQAQLASLLGATAQLPDTVLKHPRSALGKSTQDAIRAGVVVSFQGGANEILRQLSAALKVRRPHLILTGGDADFLKKSLPYRPSLRPLLVFDGLRIIGHRVWHASH